MRAHIQKLIDEMNSVDVVDEADALAQLCAAARGLAARCGNTGLMTGPRGEVAGLRNRIASILTGMGPLSKTSMLRVMHDVRSHDLNVALQGMLADGEISSSSFSAIGRPTTHWFIGTKPPEWLSPISDDDYVLEKIRKAAGDGKTVSRTALLRCARKLTSRQIDEVIARLHEDGRLLLARQDSGGRPRMLIQLADRPPDNPLAMGGDSG